MIILSKVLDVILESKYRLIKVLRLGESDVREVDEAAPFGIDSSPVNDMIAVYSDTLTKGEPVIIGYLNKNQIADKGEVRFYSSDKNGAQKFYVWLKNSGTVEIGGDVDNMVRYSKLEEAFNELKGKYNDLANKFNSHIHSGGTNTGGITGTITTPAAAQSGANIAPAKIEEIKTM